MSVLQEQSEPRQRGAVFAAVGLFGALGQAAGILLGGRSDGPVGPLSLLEIQGCLDLLGGVIALLWLPCPVTVGRPTRRRTPLLAHDEPGLYEHVLGREPESSAVTARPVGPISRSSTARATSSGDCSTLEMPIASATGVLSNPMTG